MPRSWYLVGLVLGSLLLLSNQVSSQADSFSLSFSYGGLPPLPCVYGGIPYLHSESWKTDHCTVCTCTNSTAHCETQSCPPAFCTTPIKLEGDCCFLCPYNVTVDRIQPIIQGRLDPTGDGYTRLVLAVDVRFKETSTGVSGESLWELDAWLVPVSSSIRINYTERILSTDQRSQNYVKESGKPLTFLDVLYSFTAPFPNCEEANVCVELRRGRNAQPSPEGLPFHFQGHNGRESLTGCTTLCSGRDTSPCVDSKGIHWHEDVWQQDLCTECTCNNGTPECSAEECPTPDCKRPVRLEGECCISCPYHVRVRRVSPLIVAHGLIGNQQDQVHLRVPITFKETQHTTNVEGVNLWKLSAWLSLPQTNTRYDYTDQILDKNQRSQTYEKGKELAFEDLEFRIVHPSVIACDSPFFICVRFDMDPHYQTVHDRGFEVSGFPNSSSLTGCKSTKLPEKWCGNLDQSGTSDSGNTKSLKSCHLDGSVYAHDEEWTLRDCTACECDNGTVRCHTEYCEPTPCEAPIKHPDECCFICPSEPFVKTDVCVPLVISALVLFGIFVVVLIVYLRRRKKVETQKRVDDMVLITS